MARFLVATFVAVLFSTTATAQDRDPLANLVNWGSHIDPSVCWVNRAPSGWAMHPNRLVIENRTRHMLALSVNGGTVDVVQARYSGGQPLPTTVIAKTGNGTERFTALKYGERCFAVLPDMGAYEARQTGWRVSAHALEHHGPPGHFNWIGNSWLYSQGLVDSGREDTDRAFLRSTTASVGYTIVFDEREFN